MQSSELSIFTKKCAILLLFIIGWVLVYIIRDILFLAAFALFAVLLAHPALTAMEKKRIPTWIAAILLIIGVVGIIGTGIASALPLIFEGLQSSLESLSKIDYASVFHALPTWIQTNLATSLNVPSILKIVTENSQSILTNAKNIFLQGSGILVSVASGTLNIGAVIVFAFFFSLERREIAKFLLSKLPKSTQKTIISKQGKVFEIVRGWGKWQLLLSFSIGIFTYIGLTILSLFWIQIPHIGPLALVAGITEFIPYAGPFIALLPALSLALPEGWVAIAAIIILYTIIQQCENNFLVPYLVGKQLQLSASYVLVSTAIGFSIGGIIGVLVALPIAALINIFFLEK